MMKSKPILGAILISLITSVEVSQADPKPLSCEVQMLLNGLAAMQRDQGVSRASNTLSTQPDSDLTKREIKEILDRVYIEKRNKTPDEIKDAVYKACQSGR